MFRGFGRALESLDAAFASPSNNHYVNRTISVENFGRVRLQEVFAEGGFSFLHKAELLDRAGPPIAVKRLSVAEPDALRRAKAEAKWLATIPLHPNVVVYHGCCFAPPDAFLVFELVDGGSLSEYLDRRKAAISPGLALNIFSDVMSAIAHLHAQSPPIACRDLKLENVLWDPAQQRFKLCDFGSATTIAKRYTDRRELQAADDEIRENSSAMYRAPEMCGMSDLKVAVELNLRGADSDCEIV
jgi:serine/threonine protein kinase